MRESNEMGRCLPISQPPASPHTSLGSHDAGQSRTALDEGTRSLTESSHEPGADGLGVTRFI